MVDTPVRMDRVHSERRQRAHRRVADDPQGCEGQAVCRSEFSAHVRLHVDCDGSGRRPQGRLFGCIENDRLGARQQTAHHTSSRALCKRRQLGCK
jgi:hypothetical protein